jgi:7-cyano-7-deazaguanine synthase in queuosine biosynthesis
MKALTDKIIEALQSAKKISSPPEDGSGWRDGIDHCIEAIQDAVKSATFEEVAREMMRLLAEQYHPHVTSIITSTQAELVEGLKATGQITEYLKD